MPYAKIVIYRGRRGLLTRSQYRARVVHQNGNTLWTTPEGYNNKADLREMCRRSMPNVEIEDLTL